MNARALDRGNLVAANPMWPYSLHARIVNSGKLNREDVLDCLVLAKAAFDHRENLSWKVAELAQYNLRLKHENEFMLRLINEKFPEG